jgi:TRAP-type C4-dicarboxylate transport system substrate-binding protein
VGRQALLFAVAATLVVAATGCGGAGENKAGKSGAAEETVVLKLAQHDSSFSGRQFAAAVERRSGGAIRIDVTDGWESDRVDSERRTVRDVRVGEADLGVVAARAWDTLGVTSFQALLAPFLVGTLEHERRVLESPLAARMLAGVARAGVVGVALLPGALRRPFGYRRPLVGREDYRGARMGVKPGYVEDETFRTLGASTRDYLTLTGASREGAAVDLSTIATLGWRGRTLATNVVFWPRAETVIMNREAFLALTPHQRQILRSAERDAMRPRLAEIGRIEATALQSLCARRLTRLVAASATQIAALRAAVKPVYGELGRNPRTRQLMAEIRGLDDGTATDPLRCPGPAAGSVARLEGTWQSAVTGRELLAAGASAAEAATYQGSGMLELHDGRWVFRGDHTTVTGSYALTGDLVRLTMRTCTSNPCSPGATTEYTWSVYRDTLSLTRQTGPFWPRLVAKPSRRAG